MGDGGIQARIKAGQTVKRTFIRWKLHRLFGPLETPMLWLAHLIRLSRWAARGKAEFPDRPALYEAVIRREGLEGPIDYLEFGVGRGRSFLWWNGRNRDPGSRFTGFDTFTGLPESWGPFGAGAFSTGGETPAGVDERARFVKGLFQDTLPGFLAGYRVERRKVVHLDADLYSSTLFVLTSLAPFLRPGDVLLFDEFGVPLHEHRALGDFLAAYPFRVETVGMARNWLHVGMKVV